MASLPPSDDPLLRFLKRTIKDRSTLDDVGRRLSPSDNASWLSAALLGKRGLSVQRVHQILDDLKIDEGRFWIEYGKSLGQAQHAPRAARPEELLRRARAGQSAAAEMLDRVGALALEPMGRTGLLDVVPEARRIDTLRESNRDSALLQAEIWLLGVMRHKAERKQLGESQVAELAAALGAWASVQRVHGRALVSARALEISLSMHGTNRCTPAYADLLERAALTLRDLGAAEDGLSMAQAAVGLFECFGNEAHVAKALMVVGILAGNCQEWALATASLARCLEHPGSDDLRRGAAHLALARFANARGEWNETLAQLTAARSLMGPSAPARMMINVSWLEADVTARSGDFEEAIRIVDAIRQRAIEHLEPLDLFFLLLDVATWIKGSGDQVRFNRHLVTMGELLPLLEPQPLAFAAVGKFLSAARSQPLGQVGLGEVVKGLRALRSSFR